MADGNTFYLKRGDRLPILRKQLLAPDGTVQSLVGVTVTFKMADAQTGVMVVTSGAVTVTDAANGWVEYAWAANDTLNAGIFNAEFEGSFAGLPMTFPNFGFLRVQIGADLR